MSNDVLRQAMVLALLGIPLALTACSRAETPAPAATEPAAAAPAAEAAGPSVPVATVTLQPTAGKQATGSLVLSQREGFVGVTGSVSGLTAGAQHGIHVHEKGDCSAPDASSAGEHFNPTQQPHGNPAGAQHHTGDMLNLQADAQGNAAVSLELRGATLRDGAASDVSGRAVIVHDKPDDYTSQPAGNSGDRIACAVIS